MRAMRMTAEQVNITTTPLATGRISANYQPRRDALYIIRLMMREDIALLLLSHTSYASKHMRAPPRLVDKIRNFGEMNVMLQNLAWRSEHGANHHEQGEGPR